MSAVPLRTAFLATIAIGDVAACALAENDGGPPSSEAAREAAPAYWEAIASPAVLGAESAGRVAANRLGRQE